MPALNNPSGDFQKLHQALPPFQPIVPVSFLPYLAYTLLTLTFGLAFYFSTSVLTWHPSIRALTSLY